MPQSTPTQHSNKKNVLLIGWGKKNKYFRTDNKALGHASVEVNHHQSLGQ
jgi:hypothetical protein